MSRNKNRYVSREALSLLSHFKDIGEVKERIIKDASEASKTAVEMDMLSYNDIDKEINRLMNLANHENFEKRMNTLLKPLDIHINVQNYNDS